MLNLHLYQPYAHPTPFHPTHSYIYPPPSLPTSISQHYILPYPIPILPTFTYTQPPPLPTVLTPPKPSYTHPHNSILLSLISAHLHLYPRLYHSTTPYPTPFRPYPLLPILNLYLYPPYSTHPNPPTLFPPNPLSPLPISTSTYVHIIALHPTLPIQKSDSSLTERLYYT